MAAWTESWKDLVQQPGNLSPTTTVIKTSLFTLLPNNKDSVGNVRSRLPLIFWFIYHDDPWWFKICFPPESKSALFQLMFDQQTKNIIQTKALWALFVCVSVPFYCLMEQNFTQLTQSWLLSASGNRICWPPATTRLCPGLHSTTKPVWPPHQSNSRSLLDMNHLRLLICIPMSLKLPLCFVVLQQVHFVGILFLMLLACGLWLDCDVFVLLFKTSVAIHSGGCDPCMCVSDRKERSLLRGFTVN